MIYDAESDELVLKSGRRIYTVLGQIGIAEDALEATYGSDGFLEESLSGKLSLDERKELADYMISLWTKYKEVMP